MSSLPTLGRAPISRAALGAVLAVAVAACSSVGTPGAVTPLPTADRSSCPTSQPPALDAGATRTVEVKTSKGSITLKIDGSLAPIAAGNFVALAACHFYDGLKFHRVVPGFVIQGGDPKGDGTGGPGYTIDDEQVTTTYHRGTLAMARTKAPHSQGSQFFIVLADDAATSLASANTYAIFGEVTAGMEVVDAIAAAADAELPSQPIAMDSLSVSQP